MVLNDCTETSTVETVLHECFEGEKIVKHGVEYKAGTTITVTCNEKQMEDLQSLYVKLNLPQFVFACFKIVVAVRPHCRVHVFYRC